MDRLQLVVNSKTPETREDLVADALRSGILSGAYKPGEKLDQRKIAGELGVSRTTLRGGLRTLSAEGLVTVIPRRGARVTERSIAELEELQFIRQLMEGAAARRGASRMDDLQLDSLGKILEMAENTSDVEEILALNSQFHSTIYSAFPQPVLMRHIEQFRNKAAPYNRVYLGSVNSKEIALAGHRRIYEACVRRDGKGAEEETHIHLEQVFERISRLTQN